MKRPVQSPTVRFWRMVDKRGPDDCWGWTGGKTPFGHGRFRRGRKDEGQVGPHCFSYELHVGPITDGLFVLHKCDNPSCVNPSHLFLGTQSANLQDCRDKGRLQGHFQNGPDARRRRGSSHPVSKLTEAQIPAIRQDPRSYCAIAKDYGVDNSLIGRIKRREAWAHV